MARTTTSQGRSMAAAATSAATRRFVVGMTALALGLAGAWAGRAHAEALAAAAVSLVVEPALATGSEGLRGAAPPTENAAAKDTAARDEPVPWTMLAAGLLGVGLIVRRRTG